MVIAVNISFLKAEQSAVYTPYVEEFCHQLIALYPGQSFVFIVNSDFRLSLTGSNVRVVEAGAGSARTWRWKWWVSVRLPSLLKKCGAHRLVSAAGYGCSRAGIPETILLPSSDFLQPGEHCTKAQAAFFSNNLAAALPRADRVLFFSGFTKSVIQDRYTLSGEKAAVLPLVPPSCFSVLPYADRKQQKEHITGGTEYLLYNGAVHAGKNIMHLLKAFSLFKKRQKTNMKLVLLNDASAVWPSLTQSLQTYRYREDIVFANVHTAEERALLTASAYAVVYPALQEDIPQPVTEALLCGVPVICANGSACAEVAGDAALYAATNDISDMAVKIMLLYKDENRRSALSQLGLNTVQQYLSAAASANPLQHLF